MAIQINIPDAAQCTPLEIEALMKFWQAMSGSECADTSQDPQVILGHTGMPILERLAKVTGTPAHYLTGNEAAECADAVPEAMTEHIMPAEIKSAGCIDDPVYDGALHGTTGTGGVGTYTILQDDSDTPLPMEDDIRPTQEINLAALFGNQVAPTVELDSNNLPWDARIHAATKAKIADGSWRKKRNLDEALEQSVEAELLSIMGAPVPPPAPPAPAAVSRVTAGWDQMREAGTVTNAQHADKMAEIAAVTRKLDMTFGEFMKFTTPLLTSGQITQQQLATISVAVGLPHAVALQKREDMIPAVLQRMYAILDGAA
jgi:hypothetical protein